MMRRNVTYQTDDYLQSDYSQKPYRSFIDKYIADYDAAGRLPGFTNFNGTQTTYSYDNANRLTSISNQGVNGTIAGYTFTLDGNGNRTSVAQNEPYAPTIGDGNIDDTYNTQKNRLQSTSAQGSFGYDDEGQLQTGYSTDYTFDYEHRLKTIGSTQFYYDGSGNRLKATRSGVTTKYIYDAAGRLLAEADASNVITKYYIYGNGLLAEVTPANNVYCYHYNGIGSTIAMTDSSQNIVNQYSYDAFGNIANQQETISQPFKYVGQYGVMTEPNGFYYMKARYYDPTVSRFISEDPSGFDGGDANLMSYVGNNPVTGIDPSGLTVIIDINRTTYTNNSIVSTINVMSTESNSTFSGYTLENRNPPNSNLPVTPGTYDAFTRTDHTPDRIELIGVQNAQNVQLHNGNYPWQSRGCFLVGSSTSTDFVGNSVNSMNQINQIISNDGGTILININGNNGRAGGSPGK